MFQWSQPEPYSHAGRVGTLAEHLGRRPDEKLLIVNADDFGLTEGTNKTALDLYNDNLISSATIMMTGTAAESGVTLIRKSGLDCGVHITLTSSLEKQPASPVTGSNQVSSLVNDAGRFHFDRDQFFETATPEEALLEATAQVEAAIDSGIPISHIDSHEGTLQLRPQFAEIYVGLALKFALPIRMGSRALLHQLGLSPGWIEKLRGAGLHFPDNLVYLPIDSFSSLEEKTDYIVKLLKDLPPGVTELFFHPLNPDYADSELAGGDEISRFRFWDYRLLTGEAYQSALKDTGAELISFAPLRELCKQSVGL